MVSRLFLLILLSVPTPAYSRKAFTLQKQAKKFNAVESSITRTGRVIEVPTDHSKVQLRQGLLWAIPVLSSVFAFASFGALTHGFDAIVKLVSHNTWFPSTDEEVDLQTQVVTQVVNGPVITSISVLFATLVSITVSFLHDRQIRMKSLLVNQLDELQNLQLMIEHLPESMREDAKLLTHRYTENFLDNEDEGMNTFPSSLQKLSLFFQAQIANSRRQSPLMGMAYECVTRIHEAHSDRCLLLRSKFPAMHYTTLGLLAFSICISYLVATDQTHLIFYSLQVRILWTILIGAFTSLAVVCYDLSSPFLGAYQVSQTCLHVWYVVALFLSERLILDLMLCLVSSSRLATITFRRLAMMRYPIMTINNAIFYWA